MADSTITTTKDRIDTIDVLRGFALAGILYAHMILWFTGAALPLEVYFSYDNTADYVAFAIFGAFVFGKFFSVFSFLFGLGFYLHFRKKKAKAGHYRTYIWRLFLLFLIGIIHHTVWRGDILAIYAVLGVLLLAFHRLPSGLMLVLSFLLIINLPNHILDAFEPVNSEIELSLPMEEEAQAYYALVEKGGFVKNLQQNWSSWLSKINYQLESGRLLMTFGYFLLGFYAGRAKLFTSIEQNFPRFLRWNKFTSRGIIFLLLTGWLMLLFDYVTIPRIEVVPEYQWMAGFLFSIYNACVTIFYITGITILFRARAFRSILEPLAAMGRMALTNYLLQTFFGLLLFYHFGLGLFDKTSPALNVLIGVGIFYLQLSFSQWWLARFKQGPVEWLWKSLTYFRPAPFVKKAKEAGAISR